MRLLPILILAAAFLTMFLPGCGRDRADDKVKPPVYEDGLSVQAWNALDTSADFEEAMRLQKEAVALLHEGRAGRTPSPCSSRWHTFSFHKETLARRGTISTRLWILCQRADGVSPRKASSCSMET